VAHLLQRQILLVSLKVFEALIKLGIGTSAVCMAFYAYSKAFPIRPARTFHAWMRNQFGERLFQIFFKTYTERVTATI
jgi:protoporphyrinogen oxidase